MVSPRVRATCRNGSTSPVTEKTGMAGFLSHLIRCSPTHTWRGPRTWLDVDAVVACQWPEAALVALANGAELPVATSAVDFTEHHRRFGRRVFRQVEAGDLGIA